MRTNQENYKWGFLYFDSKAKKVILPKVNPALGWTFNFGSPIAYVIIVVFVLLLIFVR